MNSVQATDGEAPRSLRGLRVLLAEDEFLVALVLAEELEGHGCRIVGPYHNVADALRAATSEEADVAILDINMNGEMTYAVADALAARGIPHVFLSGYSASTVPERYRDVQCFSKPSDPAVLIRKIRQIAVPNS